MTSEIRDLLITVIKCNINMLRRGTMETFYPRLMLAILEGSTAELFSTDNYFYMSLREACPEGHAVWNYVKILHDRRHGSI